MKYYITLEWILPRDATLARYMPKSFVCLSVCLSVSLSQVSVPLKRLNAGSCKQRHTIGLVLRHDFSFIMPKISAKLKRGHPNGGAKCRWEVKIGDFRQITCYNSKISTVVRVGILAGLQVNHTERSPLFAARLP